ncbi:butyrophilin-like protein 3 [Morone saxatilis]|uniref:butyrophilin-like protein 3 n=1 Tax=Morone saxatilis TaxID=34816 RepID=UPI0015E1E5C0|nr:butyrophilin-like protein 3 [Morone saxatilis]
MGSMTIKTCFVFALASLCGAAPVSDPLVVLVRSSVSVHFGNDTTLPCWLNPPQNAEGLEVRWYRSGHYDSPIMLYRAKKFQNVSQEASYVGRISFGLKDSSSGGLKGGDVSLKLENTRLQDAGVYSCYVSSDQGYDSATISLSVTNTGTLPLLSVVWQEDNMVNVSCESGGWYPEPSLRWLHQGKVLSPKSLKNSKDSSGLMSVHSWLLVSSPSEVSCSVGLSDKDTKEAKVRLENISTPAKQESGSSAGGWVAFALLLIAVLAGLGLFFFKNRCKYSIFGKSGGDQTDETDNLLPQEVIQSTDLSTAKMHYENVKLAKTVNDYLKIKDCMLRDVPLKDFPDGKKVTCLTAIKGTPSFSSGQHYWEVSLGNASIRPKESWWLGVTSATAFPEKSDFTPTASNGFWFLSSSPDSADHFQFSTEPKVLLPVSSRPLTVGVYLDYDRGELSFYNVEQERLIGSLTAKFTGEVFPLFNPGKNDKGPMTLIQRTEEGPSTDMGNSVESAAP